MATDPATFIAALFVEPVDILGFSVTRGRKDPQSGTFANPHFCHNLGSGVPRGTERGNPTGVDSCRTLNHGCIRKDAIVQNPYPKELAELTVNHANAGKSDS